MSEQAAAQLAPELGHEKLKVVIYTIPMMGHALPMVSIGRTMAQRGHQVIFAVSEGLGSKLKDLCKAAGMRYFGLSDGVTSPYLRTQDPLGPVFEEFLEADQADFDALVEKESPDVVVSDYASGAPFDICKEKKVPLVLNYALPGTIVKRMRIMINIPLLGRVAPYVMSADMKHPLTFINQRTLPVSTRTLNIVNSSPALDGPLQLPANYFVSGPLDGFEKRELCPEKHADLLTFLEKARSAQKPVAYITTGSLMQLSQEQVLALYEGFAACDIWVVWSLKKDKQQLLPEDLPEHFYVNAWIPQPELIQRPELLCVLTHCGWGGALECMLAGKAVICYAGFGDQTENATLMNARGCGPIVSEPPRSSAKDIQAAVEDVLENRESYSANAQKVSQDLRASPGPIAVAERIEDVVKNGMGDMVPQPYHLHGPEGCQIQ
ncbi:unnamed protein product [Cladocopium goreaui]|uniref:Uncharacterized protein n=1 Tax=Cladocopium goreaui TaxID=2562237 RepID=A0A9P1C0T3_9DINO|nr:unnamed protein product [Cladocopium goreaui]